jgi:hypothetical protein
MIFQRLSAEGRGGLMTFIACSFEIQLLATQFTKPSRFGLLFIG